MILAGVRPGYREAAHIVQLLRGLAAEFCPAGWSLIVEGLVALRRLIYLFQLHLHDIAIWPVLRVILPACPDELAIVCWTFIREFWSMPCNYCPWDIWTLDSEQRRQQEHVPQ